LKLDSNIKEAKDSQIKKYCVIFSKYLANFCTRDYVVCNVRY